MRRLLHLGEEGQPALRPQRVAVGLGRRLGDPSPECMSSRLHLGVRVPPQLSDSVVIWRLTCCLRCDALVRWRPVRPIDGALSPIAVFAFQLIMRQSFGSRPAASHGCPAVSGRSGVPNSAHAQEAAPYVGMCRAGWSRPEASGERCCTEPDCSKMNTRCASRSFGAGGRPCHARGPWPPQVFAGFVFLALAARIPAVRQARLTGLGLGGAVAHAARGRRCLPLPSARRRPIRRGVPPLRAIHA